MSDSITLRRRIPQAMNTEPRFYVEHCKDNHRFYVVDRHTPNQMRWVGSFGEAEVSRVLVQTICDALNAYAGQAKTHPEGSVLLEIPASQTTLTGEVHFGTDTHIYRPPAK